jgi:2-dehydropantoate 2-reductase
MRCLVFGAGAVGSVIAGRLARGHDVSIVARESHVRAIEEHGLVLTGRTESTIRNVIARTTVAELPPEPPDYALVTVKAHQTMAALGELSRFWSTSVFVSLQNGLGNEELMAERAERVLGAVINVGAIFLGPGRVFHAGEALTEIGPFQGTAMEDAVKLARILDDAGIRTRAVEDIRPAMWRKVVLNAAFNPLTALLRLRHGELLAHPELESALRDIVRESVGIARASGVLLDEGDVLDAIREVARAAPENKSSMLQDLERGRPTEIDFLNGALAARGRALGLEAPRNELLTRLIRATQRQGSSR